MQTVNCSVCSITPTRSFSFRIQSTTLSGFLKNNFSFVMSALEKPLVAMVSTTARKYYGFVAIVSKPLFVY